MQSTTSQTPAPQTPAAEAGAYRRGSFARFGPVTLGWVVLAAVGAFALTQGAAAIPARTTLALLIDQLPLIELDVSAPASWERIVVDVRLPRVLTAGVVGAALSFSGAAYQGVFRNPLADPFLLGVAAGAGLGAAIAVISPLGGSSYGFGWVPVFAFVGASIAVTIAYVVSRVGRAGSNTTLVLAGVAVSAIFGAATSFILITGGTPPPWDLTGNGYNAARIRTGNNTSKGRKVAFFSNMGPPCGLLDPR